MNRRLARFVVLVPPGRFILYRLVRDQGARSQKGEHLLHTTQVAFDALDRQIEALRDELEAVMSAATLLDDRFGSTAWAEWLDLAGLPQRMCRRSLAIPDPNVRIQVVIDGQGIAVNDLLVPTELASGAMHRISTAELDTYGYHLTLPKDALRNPDTALLVPWLKSVDSSWRGFDRNRCASWVVRREIEPGESWKVATPERPYRPA